MTGVRYGNSVAVRPLGPWGNGRRDYRWLFLCDCGNEFSAAGNEARRGKTKHCPACTSSSRLQAVRTHGRTVSREYRAWCAMKRRCMNASDTAFQHYGGRGITVCSRWISSFQNFLADMGPAQAGETLDRYPDVNGNYEPTNCRWATRLQQANNKRNNRRIEIAGVMQTLAEWSRSSGVGTSCIRDRIKRGLSGESLLQPTGGAR